MSYFTENFELVRQSFQVDTPESPLTSRMIRRAFEANECDFGRQEHTVFDRSTTLWAFLHEMLHTGNARTLESAVQAVQQLRLAKELSPNSANTSGYTTARSKIALGVPMSLLAEVAQNAELSLPREMLFCGEHVSLVDGSTDSMPDTVVNQEKYPQPKSQQPGIGFPMRRLVVLISGVTAMVQLVAFGPWSGKGTGEMGLLLSLFEQLKKVSHTMSILVADRYYCSYLLIALFAYFGMRFVTRLHGSRLIDFANGKDA